jgi:glucose/arabinose dehydrogenase
MGHRRSVALALAGLVAGSLSLTPLHPVQAAPAAPRAAVSPGFVDSPVANVSQATTVVGIPDGRVVVLSKSGAVRIIENGLLVPTPALSLPVCTESERGLLGFAADPDVGTNGAVYVYYTTQLFGSCVNRVSRFTMSGNIIDPASEVILVDAIGSPGRNHNGGDIEIGNDGFLYIAVGDGGCDPRDGSQCAGANDAAQDLSLLNGKILRVDRFTGFAAPGNPLLTNPAAVDCRARGNTASTPTTPCKELFAWGLRNPYRIAFDTNTGSTRFFINDVGQTKREEVNQGISGANYGWPEREGRCAQSYTGNGSLCPGPSAAYTQPITDYSHNEAFLDYGGDYVTGGTFIPDGAWPAQYDGGYLFADGFPGLIHFRNRAGSVNYPSPFATDVPGITDLNFVLEASGWSLYYVLISPASGQPQNVRKITYNAPEATLPGPLAYTPLPTSARTYDSRNAGADTGAIRGGTSRLVQFNPPAGAVAALVNTTYVRPRGGGYVAAWSPRTPRPFTSVANSPAGGVVANSAILPLAADGTSLVMASTTGDLVLDTLGFFTAAPSAVAAGRFIPVTPDRVFDSREASSTSNPYTEVTEGAERVLRTAVTGSRGVPSSVSAVVLSVTVLAGSSGGGNLVAHPTGGTVPGTANVNAVATDRRTNLVIVATGTGGSVDFRMRAGVEDAVVDVFGYITDASASASTTGRVTPVVANREVDTRIGFGFGRIAANTVASRNPSAIPDNAIGVVQNVTVSRTAGAGFITTFATGTSPPTVSNGNVTGPGQTRGVLSFSSLGAGSVSYRPSIDTDVIVDVFAYITS